MAPPIDSPAALTLANLAAMKSPKSSDGVLPNISSPLGPAISAPSSSSPGLQGSQGTRNGTMPTKVSPSKASGKTVMARRLDDSRALVPSPLSSKGLERRRKSARPMSGDSTSTVGVLDTGKFVQAMGENPTLAGLGLGSGWVAHTASRFAAASGTADPIEVRAHYDRLVRDQLVEACSLKDELIKELEVQVSKVSLKSDEEQDRLRNEIKTLNVQLHEAKAALSRKEDRKGSSLLGAIGGMGSMRVMAKFKSKAANAKAILEEDDGADDGEGEYDGVPDDADLTSLLGRLGLSLEDPLNEPVLGGSSGGHILRASLKHLNAARAMPKQITEDSDNSDDENNDTESNDRPSKRAVSSMRKRVSSLSKGNNPTKASASALLNLLMFGSTAKPCEAPEAQRELNSADSMRSSIGSRDKQRAQSPGQGDNSPSKRQSALTRSNSRQSPMGSSSAALLSNASSSPVSSNVKTYPEDLYRDDTVAADNIARVSVGISSLPSTWVADIVSELARQTVAVGDSLQILEAVQNINSHRDGLEKMCASVCQEVCAIVRAKAARVLLVDVDRHKVQHLSNPGFSVIKETELGKGIVGMAAQSGRAMSINYPATDCVDFLIDCDRMQGISCDTSLMAPVFQTIRGGRVIAIIQVFNKAAPPTAPLTAPKGFATFSRAPPPNASTPNFTAPDVAKLTVFARLISEAFYQAMFLKCWQNFGATIQPLVSKRNLTLSAVQSQQMVIAVLKRLRCDVHAELADLFLCLPGPAVQDVFGRSQAARVKMVFNVARLTAKGKGEADESIHVIDEAVASSWSSQACLHMLPSGQRRPVLDQPNSKGTELCDVLIESVVPSNTNASSILDMHFGEDESVVLVNKDVVVSGLPLVHQTAEDLSALRLRDSLKWNGGSSRWSREDGDTDVPEGCEQPVSRRRVVDLAIPSVAECDWAPMKPLVSGMSSLRLPSEDFGADLIVPLRGMGGILQGVIRLARLSRPKPKLAVRGPTNTAALRAMGKSSTAQKNHAKAGPQMEPLLPAMPFSDLEIQLINNQARCLSAWLQEGHSTLSHASIKASENATISTSAMPKETSKKHDTSSQACTPSFVLSCLQLSAKSQCVRLLEQTCSMLISEYASVYMFDSLRQWLVQIESVHPIKAHALQAASNLITAPASPSRHVRRNDAAVNDSSVTQPAIRYQMVGIEAESVKKNECFICADAPSHPLFDRTFDRMANFTTRSLAVHPILRPPTRGKIAETVAQRSHVVGCVVVRNCMGPHGFGEQHKILLEALCQSFAPVIAGLLEKIPLPTDKGSILQQGRHTTAKPLEMDGMI